jgi:hypothetical protein
VWVRGFDRGGEHADVMLTVRQADALLVTLGAWLSNGPQFVRLYCPGVTVPAGVESANIAVDADVHGSEDPVVVNIDFYGPRLPAWSTSRVPAASGSPVEGSSAATRACA